MDQIAALQQHCFADQTYNISRGATTCANILNYISDVSGGVYSFDGRIFDYDFAPVKAAYQDLLTKSKKVQQLYRALHISDGTNVPKFIASSKKVKESYASDNLVDYSPYYQYMLDNGHPLMVAAGEFDIRDGTRSQDVWMKKLLNLTDDFWKQDRKVYSYTNVFTNRSNVAGYYRTQGNFSLATLVKSGHFAPHDNYDGSKTMLDDFI